MAVSVTFLSVEAIRQAVREVLRLHQPDGGIPIEIEEIIEFGLEMEIRPVKALHTRFGFEGAISHDLETILVDEGIMTRFANRYRFTLAHEIGHKVLHGDIIRGLTFENKQQWKEAVELVDP